MLEENESSKDDATTETPTADDTNNSSETATESDSQTKSPAAAPSVVVTTTRRKSATRPAGPPAGGIFSAPPQDPLAEESDLPAATVAGVSGLMFQAPPEGLAPALPKPAPSEQASNANNDGEDDAEDSDDEPKRRRRSRGGRRRRKSDENDAAEEDSDESDEEQQADDSSSTRRRRRRTRVGEDPEVSPDDPENTVVKVREGRTAEDEITAVSGSTRLEAKKQRRREGREAGRRRAPIITEAEFLARRESVDRQMIVRENDDDTTQIAVLEDKVLVEHYVARESQTSLIGNVYLGKVQNVLPSMEAAFVDIGAGRNAVIYAGEVDWSNVPNGKQRKIEDALEPGQSVLVQVTKDPIGQKGARLTSQISLAGRFLVYVPGGGSNGISRKLPENERARLKGLLKEALPESAGVIVRTAAEGATEEQLTRDVAALTARWEDIESKIADGKAPQLLYAEPDLMIKVIRDLFNEDFSSLVVQGDDAWDMVSGYLSHVAPDLAERAKRWDGDEDVFAELRIDEQVHKALNRKVHLPSGGSLVIDRTEAMVVVDVNTGRFTGSGGNLEETVTKNNLEAAEEIVRQLRLRDLGGIIVIDFIDMVLESNRDLVLRRLVECLGRDRTRHQVAEVTSLGLVQMTRKRIGTGLLESFSHECSECKGRGVVVSDFPVEPKKDEGSRRGRRGGGKNGGSHQQKSKKHGRDKRSDRSGPKDSNEEADKAADAAESTDAVEPSKTAKSDEAGNAGERRSNAAQRDSQRPKESSSRPDSADASEVESTKSKTHTEAPDDSGGPVLTDAGAES